MAYSGEGLALERLRTGAPLNKPDKATFYGGGATLIGISNDDADTIRRFSVEACRDKFAVAGDADSKVIRAYDDLVTKPSGLNAGNLTRLELLQLAMQAEQERMALESQVTALQPKADALDRIANTDGSFCLTDAAKTLQVPPRQFTQRLVAMGWIYRRPQGAVWLAHQDKINALYLEHKTTTGEKSNGTEWTSTQVRVTAKGMARLAREFVAVDEPA